MEDSKLRNAGRAYHKLVHAIPKVKSFVGGGAPEPSRRARLDSFSVAPDGGDIASDLSK